MQKSLRRLNMLLRVAGSTGSPVSSTPFRLRGIRTPRLREEDLAGSGKKKRDGKTLAGLRLSPERLAGEEPEDSDGNDAYSDDDDFSDDGDSGDDRDENDEDEDDDEDDEDDDDDDDHSDEDEEEESKRRKRKQKEQDAVKQKKKKDEEKTKKKNNKKKKHSSSNTEQAIPMLTVGATQFTSGKSGSRAARKVDSKDVAISSMSLRAGPAVEFGESCDTFLASEPSSRSSPASRPKLSQEKEGTGWPP